MKPKELSKEKAVTLLQFNESQKTFSNPLLLLYCDMHGAELIWLQCWAVAIRMCKVA